MGVRRVLNLPVVQVYFAWCTTKQTQRAQTSPKNGTERKGKQFYAYYYQYNNNYLLIISYGRIHNHHGSISTAARAVLVYDRHDSILFNVVVHDDYLS